MLGNVVRDSMSGGGNHFSTTEMLIGTYNGAPLYRQMVAVSSFPNATSKTISYSSSGKNVINVWGFMQGGYTFQIPSGSDLVWYEKGSGMIFITCTANRSALSGYIVLEYTKT